MIFRSFLRVSAVTCASHVIVNVMLDPAGVAVGFARARRSPGLTDVTSRPFAVSRNPSVPLMMSAKLAFRSRLAPGGGSLQRAAGLSRPECCAHAPWDPRLLGARFSRCALVSRRHRVAVRPAVGRHGAVLPLPWAPRTCPGQVAVGGGPTMG